MPFIVATNRACDDAECSPRCRNRRVSRRAVATLEEARTAAQEPCGNDLMARLDASLIPESGGTVTLPDGTVIEVEAQTWDQIGHAADLSNRQIFNKTEAEILVAFNARESGQGKEKTR